MIFFCFIFINIFFKLITSNINLVKTSINNINEIEKEIIIITDINSKLDNNSIIKSKVVKYINIISEIKKTADANIINIKTGSISDINPLILSRELTIYKSYINFINYLQSNDIKNPDHLQEILLTLNIILLIWKRQDNTASLQCFTYTHVNDIFDAALNNKKIAFKGTVKLARASAGACTGPGGRVFSNV